MYTDVAASVQRDKICTERTDIPIRPGDQISRRTPAGVDEIFVVEDPGFRTGGEGFPDTYQMRVRRADATATAPGTVIYNITGTNARFNIHSVDSSTNIVNQAPAELFEALREAIQSKVQSSAHREELLARVAELQQETGKAGFARKYAQFMALAANHMEALGPFIPALTQLLMRAWERIYQGMHPAAARGAAAGDAPVVSRSPSQWSAGFRDILLALTSWPESGVRAGFRMKESPSRRMSATWRHNALSIEVSPDLGGREGATGQRCRHSA